MKGLRFLDRHARWRQMAGGYADRELGTRDAARFEAHMAACAACASLLAETRTLKTLLAGLLEVEPTRSFTLTPAMAAPASPARRSRPRTTYVARAAQLAAGFAAAALAVIVVVDVAPSGGGDGAPGAAQEAAAPVQDALDERLPSGQGEPATTAESGGATPAGTGTAAATSSTGQDAGAQPSPSLAGGVAGAAEAPPETPTDSPAPATGGQESGRDGGGAEFQDKSAGDDGGTGSGEDAGAPANGADAVALAQETGGDDNGAWLRIAEAALGGVLAVAVAAWLGLWLAGRRAG